MLVREIVALIETMPLVPLPEIIGHDAVVVLAPHPDDETLGCGGLVAAACAAGRRVEIVVVTDGSKSHPNSRAYPASRLAALRRAETACAAAALGLAPGHLRHLGFEDTKAAREGVPFHRAVDAVSALVHEIGAGTLFVTWGRDPHCDHEAVAEMAEAVARRTGVRLWFYPIWSLHLPPDLALDMPDLWGVRFDIRPWLETKRTAVMCHASQMTGLIDDDPDGFRFTPLTLAPFLAPYERFIEGRP